MDASVLLFLLDHDASIRVLVRAVGADVADLCQRLPVGEALGPRLDQVRRRTVDWIGGYRADVPRPATYREIAHEELAMADGHFISVEVVLKDGRTVTGRANDGSAAWLCPCGYPSPLLGTWFPDPSVVHCPGCHRWYKFVKGRDRIEELIPAEVSPR